MAVEAFVL